MQLQVQTLVCVLDFRRKINERENKKYPGFDRGR